MDYGYLGEAYKWGPDQVDDLPWSFRKELIEIDKTARQEIAKDGRRS